MIPRQVQNQFRNSKADVQIFYGAGNLGTITTYSWTKPIGVSQIYMLLIGAGGPGDGTTYGGNSGNITTWFGAAQNVPDYLKIAPAITAQTLGIGAQPSYIYYSGTSTNIILLQAGSGKISGGANISDTANTFACSGFYQNTVGQTGSTGAQTPSTTTFLSGGGVGGATISSNYGYSSSSGDGFFQLQPISVGVGSSSNATPDIAAIGCGGSLNGYGGQGMILIASL